MKIEKIKTKNWMEHHRHGSIIIGKKIIIYSRELQEFSFIEVEKIKEFIEILRT